ncbi:hypothetical protein RF11_10002 [Thelohanellus kitauei]|uniref:Uncharacterized protein n=1 Tax=Thelohanellus kitauei TaxID=669202 RepID=A0A0C2MXB6_THEKT|nr:hypothetical protein RF11_10002 [Thelohanellus kitauei]
MGKFNLLISQTDGPENFISTIIYDKNENNFTTLHKSDNGTQCKLIFDEATNIPVTVSTLDEVDTARSFNKFIKEHLKEKKTELQLLELDDLLYQQKIQYYGQNLPVVVAQINEDTNQTEFVTSNIFSYFEPQLRDAIKGQNYTRQQIEKVEEEIEDWKRALNFK